MISTGAMVKWGKVYQNLMVDVKATNIKLMDRACRIVAEATGVDIAEAKIVLGQAENEVKPAILMIMTGVNFVEARHLLARHQGYLRLALAEKK
jgi:N-acetylmuramic acid 6-phosphate etherase